jgi:hypothetical protein
MLLTAFILEAVFGVAFIVAPAFTMAPFGVVLDGVSAGLLRLFGTALLGFAVLLGSALRTTNREVKGVAVRALGAYYAFSSFAVLWLKLAGHLNGLGWGMLATHVALAAWFLSALKRGKS